jgi:hypothetical protein
VEHTLVRIPVLAVPAPSVQCLCLVRLNALGGVGEGGGNVTCLGAWVCEHGFLSIHLPAIPPAHAKPDFIPNPHLPPRQSNKPLPSSPPPSINPPPIPFMVLQTAHDVALQAAASALQTSEQRALQEQLDAEMRLLTALSHSSRVLAEGGGAGGAAPGALPCLEELQKEMRVTLTEVTTLSRRCADLEVRSGWLGD